MDSNLYVLNPSLESESVESAMTPRAAPNWSRSGDRQACDLTAESSWKTLDRLNLPSDWEFFADRRKMSPEDQASFERIAFRHGQAYDSYLAVEPDGQAMMSADRQMGFAILNCRHVWHIPGGVLAAPERKRELLITLAEIARRNRLIIGIHSVNESDCQLMRELGYEINKFGEEPTLDLRRHSWAGSQFSWVRQQSNHCEREGIVCREIRRKDLAPEQWTEIAGQLERITADDLKDRGVSELRGLEGRLFLDHLGRRRIFVAYQDDSHRLATPTAEDGASPPPSGVAAIQAFLICNPINQGTDWAFEMYRRRKHAVRGVIPHLMRTTIDQMRSEGVRNIRLCTVPGKGAGPGADPRQHWVVGWIMRFWYERLDFLLNVHGQCHFKSRFRPKFENRYLCVTPRSTLFSISTFLSITGATIRPMNCLRQFIRHIRYPVPKARLPNSQP